LNCRSFTKSFLCDIQNLKTIGCGRDLQPARPRPTLAKMGLEIRLETETSLETPSLVFCFRNLRVLDATVQHR